MKNILYLLVFLPLFSCTKEVPHNWQYDQQMLVYRTKCAPDTITVLRTADQKTGSEMDVIFHGLTYEKWVAKSDLMFIPIYQVLDLDDSTWVESKILRCGYCLNSK